MKPMNLIVFQWHVVKAYSEDHFIEFSPNCNPRLVRLLFLL